MALFSNEELEKYKTEIQFLPPYRSHYWSLIYRILMLLTSIIIPIAGGCVNSKNPLKTTLRQILSADTWVWGITAFTNLIGLIYYGITHPKGSFKETESKSEENVEKLDEEQEEDSVPLTRKKLFRIKKKKYDKELGDILIER